MLKVKNVRNVAMMGVPLFLLCGCSNGDVAITPIDNDHHSMFVRSRHRGNDARGYHEAHRCRYPRLLPYKRGQYRSWT